MKLSSGHNYYDILTPRIPYLKNLPTIIWHNRDIYAVCVQFNSQKSLKKCAEILGYYFRREHNYDFAPYESSAHTDESLHLVLMLKQQYRDSYFAIGCIAFEHCQYYSDIPKGWMLSWAWMHPYFRCKGVISACYPRLLNEYKDFYFLFPISKAMNHLIDKCGTESQKNLLHGLKSE